MTIGQFIADGRGYMRNWPIVNQLVIIKSEKFQIFCVCVKGPNEQLDEVSTGFIKISWKNRAFSFSCEMFSQAREIKG